MTQAGGEQVFGPTFLAADEPLGAVVDGTDLSNSNSILGKLNRALDPGMVGGAFYPLRKGFETVALWILGAGLILQVAQALAVGNGGDQRLADLAKRTIIILALLWSYVLWDRILFTAVAQPVVKMLSSPVIQNQILTAMRNNSMVPRSLTVNTSSNPYRSLSETAQRSIPCSVAATSGVPASRNCAPDATTGAMIRRANESPGGANGNPAVKADFFSSTVTGIIQILLNLFMAAVLWFVWLGVIIGRAFSLVLAPVAIAWGIMSPGGSYKWFKGHADLCLKPIGLALGGLFIWGIFTAIFAGNIIASTNVVGTALKAAIAVVSVIIILKTGAMSKLVAGDVTGAAQGIGQGFSDRAMSYAGTAGKGAFATAGALRGAGGPGNILRQSQSRLRTAGEAARLSALGQGKSEKRAGWSSRIGRAGAVIREAGAARDWAKKSVVKPGDLSAKTLLSWKATKGMSTEAYKQARDSMQKDNLSRPIQRSADAVASMRGLQSQNDEMNLRSNMGLTPKLRAGEQAPTLANSTLSGANTKEAAASTALLQSITRTNPDGGAQVLMTVTEENGVTRTSMDQSSANALGRAMDSQPEIAKIVTDLLAQEMGAANVPMVQGSTGQIPDLSKAIGMSASAERIVADVAVRLTAYRSEMVRREAISQQARGAQVAEGSALEQVARTSPLLNEADTGSTVVTQSERVLRQAWYETASAQERAQAGFAPAASPSELSRLVTNDAAWQGSNNPLKDAASASSWESLASTRPAIGAKIEQIQASILSQLQGFGGMQSSGGEYGADADHFRQTLELRFRAADGSFYSQAERLLPGSGAEQIMAAAQKMLDEQIAQKQIMVPNKSEEQTPESYQGMLRTWRMDVMFGTAGEKVVNGRETTTVNG